MRVILGLLTVLICLGHSMNAGAGMPSDFGYDGQYEELRVTKTDGSAVVLTQANISPGTIHSDSEDVGFDAVRRLEYKTGSRAKAGSIWGGILGCAIGVGVALGTEKTEIEMVGGYRVETTTIQTWPIYVFTLGGALLGRAIGASTHTYDTLYDEEPSMSTAMPPARQLGLGLTAAGSGHVPYLTLSYRF